MLAPRLDEDTTIVTCPFSLIITKHAALQALGTLLGHPPLDAWSERQLICSYLCFHHLCPEQRSILRDRSSPAFVHDLCRTAPPRRCDIFRTSNVFPLLRTC